jgi:bis(5'-adenosyl)-triphosphatase
MYSNVPDCPFCSPSAELAVIACWEHWKAIYNASPVVPGHSLMIPIRHVESIADLSSGEERQFFPALNELIDALLLAYDAGGYDLALQSGSTAGQSIGHLHFHILPRKRNDLPAEISWTSQLGIGQPLDDGPRKQLGLAQMKAEARRIAEHIPSRESR